jgi:hypothetical protein
MTYQETPALLLPYAHLAERVTPLFSIKLSYLTPSRVLLRFFHFEHKDQDLLRTTIAGNSTSASQVAGIAGMHYYALWFLF